LQYCGNEIIGRSEIKQKDKEKTHWLNIYSAKTRNLGAKARNLQRKNLQLWRKNSQLLKISKRKYSDNQLVSKHYNQP
jgi:hypothetical protein